jgi:hypothetical protein
MGLLVRRPGRSVRRAGGWAGQALRLLHGKWRGRQTHGWTDGWTDGQADWRMDRQIAGCTAVAAGQTGARVGCADAVVMLVRRFCDIVMTFARHFCDMVVTLL